jgi:hypothetical protein
LLEIDMTGEDRKKRPKAQRNGPRRSFIEHEHPGSDGPEPEPGPEPASAPNPGVRGVIQGAVELGYNVIEEHLEHGRQAAQRVRAGSYTSSDIEDDLSQLVERLARRSKDLTAAWLEVVSAATKTLSGRAPDAGRPAEPARATPVSIEVHSTRPARVTVELHPGSQPFAPTVQALYPKPPARGQLSDVRFALSEDRTHSILVVTIPDDLPEGTYSGVITDSATHRPGGTLCVLVHPKN